MGDPNSPAEQYARDTRRAQAYLDEVQRRKPRHNQGGGFDPIKLLGWPMTIAAITGGVLYALIHNYGLARVLYFLTHWNSPL